MGVAVIVPCDHSFGWEAPVFHLDRGFLRGIDRCGMSAVDDLTLCAIPATWWGLSLSPSQVPRYGTPKKPRAPVRGFFFFAKTC
jgi:hypothetical protein